MSLPIAKTNEWAQNTSQDVKPIKKQIVIYQNSKTSGYLNKFEKTNYMPFMIEDQIFLEKYEQIRTRS